MFLAALSLAWHCLGNDGLSETAGSKKNYVKAFAAYLQNNVLNYFHSKNGKWQNASKVGISDAKLCYKLTYISFTTQLNISKSHSPRYLVPNLLVKLGFRG